MKKSLRYLMFALLYFSQGAIMSYVTALNALYLQSFGLGMSQVGIIGTMAMIPFVLKIFLGILSDRVDFLGFGHRKPYILIGLAIQAMCLVFLPTVDPGQNFMSYAILAMAIMTGMALYDTCTDGLALDTTPKEEEGIIQGYMVGGRAAGMVIVSALLGTLVQRTSWTIGFYFLAAVTLLPLPLVLHAREPQRSAARTFDWKAFKCFGKANVLALGILGALYSFIINGTNQLVNPSLTQEFNIDLATAGYIATVLGCGIVLGGLVGGNITDRIGQKRSLQIALLVSVISIGLLAGMFSARMAWILVFIFGFAYGFYETVYFALSMHITDSHIAATMFSILMAVANIGTGIGLAVAGALADWLGYPSTYLILALLNLAALPLINTIISIKTATVETVTQ
jgi:PAT family beta-lactamase induction signal transducer AmpG